MKREFWTMVFAFFQFLVLYADENTKIYEAQCLKAATDTKVSESAFKAALQKVKNSCKTQQEKQYFDEFKELAEAKYRGRPLVTAVIGFSCNDSSLAMVLKPADVAERLESHLDDSFEKVTRTDLDKVIAEQNLQNSDLFENSTRTKLGNLVGAQYIVSGSIQKTSGKISIIARCIEVSSGKIIKTGQIEFKDANEYSALIPYLAAQLSMRHLRKTDVTLSRYSEKYLNAANQNLFKGNFDAAQQNISRGMMFIYGNNGKNTVIPMQMLLAENTCSTEKRLYGDSVAILDKAVDNAKHIFGDTDDVVIHYYYNLAQSHLGNGNLTKAKEAYRDAMQRLNRTKNGAQYSTQFTALSQSLNRVETKTTFSYDEKAFTRKNNAQIGKSLFKKGNLPPQIDSNSEPEKEKSSSDEKKMEIPLTAVDKKSGLSITEKTAPTTAGKAKSDEVRNLIKQAGLHYEKKQWPQMLGALSELKQKDPANTDAKEILSKYQKHQYEAAKTAFTHKNFSQAIDYMKSPEMQLDAAKSLFLARCYEKSGNTQQAFSQYQHAADLKNATAYQWLGLHYFKAGNKKQAAEFYQKAAENGRPRCYFFLSILYLSKRHNMYDENKGIECLKKAAEAGSPVAQYNLGCCYANFKGTTYAALPYNRNEAIHWLKKAEKNGIKQATRAIERLTR